MSHVHPFPSLVHAKRGWPYLALAALWLLLFWRYLLPGPGQVAFPDGDFTQQFYVFRDIAYRALAGGHWPLWANCFFAGYPFHADPQSQLFYPPVWISFGLLRLMGWGSFPLFALTIEALMHYLAASLLTFAFLRAEVAGLWPQQPIAGSSLARATMPALAGAITFTYGGYLTGYPPLQTGILETATWLPLALIALRGLAAAPPQPRQWLGRASLAALALALAFFAGHPQTFMLVGYVAVAYFLHRAGLAGLSWRAGIARAATALGLLLGLALVQLGPQIQFLTLSTRAALTYDQLATGFPLGVLAHLLFTDNLWSPLFVGTLPLALALAAVAGALRLARLQAEARRTLLFWLAVAVVGLLLSFGGNAAAYPAAYWLAPGFGIFRGQERAALWVAFGLSVLAAMGASLLLAGEGRRARILARAAGRAALLLLPAALFLMLLTSVLRDANPQAGGLQTLPERLTGLVLGLGLATLALFAASRFAAQGQRARVGLLFVGVAAFELFTAATPSNRVPVFDPYPYLPILDPVQSDSDPFFRVQADAPTMQGHFGCGYGLAEWGGISPIRLAAWEAFEAQARESQRWKMLGIKYLVTWKNGALTRENELPPAERVAEGAAPHGEAKVYRLYEIPRRAWVVREVRGVENSTGLFAALNASDFDPFSVALVVEGAAPSLGQAPASATVETLADRPGRLALRVNSDSAGLLVVSEAHYPGWAASVDGRPVDILKVDGLLMGLAIPPGETSVLLEYRPPLLLVGGVATAATLVLCAGFILRDWLARRNAAQA